MKNSELRQFVLKMIIVGTGIGCVAIGIHMFYQKIQMNVAQISIPTGLVLLIVGLVIIALVLRRPAEAISGRVSTKIWYVVFLILIVFLIVYTFTHYTLEESSQYTILVDLVLIILALTGAVGYGVYRWISRNVADRVTRAIKEGQSFTRAQVETSLGFWYFEQYKTESKRKEEIDEIRTKLAKIQAHQKNKENSTEAINNDPMSYLKHAIERTMKALEFMKELDEKKYEEFICVCKNNLAYYLAERQKLGAANLGDKELAKNYADYIRGKIGRYPSYKTDFTDTCTFVQQQFPNNSA